MASRLGQDPVQLALKRTRHWYELTVVTKDRPRLFATVAGALAACGMNIGKAGAFSNSSGTVVDTFQLHRPLSHAGNESAGVGALQDHRARRAVGKARPEAHAARAPGNGKRSACKRYADAPQIQFDNECSAHSTLIEIVTQDQPGLLYRISSAFSAAGLQHRHRADRHRRPDRDRRVLPHHGRRKAHRRSTRNACANRCCSELSVVTKLCLSARLTDRRMIGMLSCRHLVPRTGCISSSRNEIVVY